MNISYYKAFTKDIPIIAKLAEKIWNKHYVGIITQEQINYMLKKMYSEESLLEQMNMGQEFTIVKINNIPKGYISLSTQDNKHYFLHKFYIDVEAQNIGIGGQLFQYILLEYSNAKSIELTVNRQNYKAINFYFKQGFKIERVADFDIGNGFYMNDFVMVKTMKK